MNKKLTPLEALDYIGLYKFSGSKQLLRDYSEREFKIIETALKRSEEYKHNKEVYLRQNNGLVSKLAKYEKEHKAFEIIVKKKVEIAWFINCLEESEVLPNYNAFEHYNRGIGEPLTHEEFDLLTEVFK